MAGESEFKQLLERVTRSEKFLGLDDDGRDGLIRAHTELFNESNPQSDFNALKGIAAERNRDLIRIQENGRRVQPWDQVTDQLVTILPDDFDKLSKSDRLEALEEARSQTETLADDIDYVNRDDLQFQFDAILNQEERETRGGETTFVGDKFARIADGIVNAAVSPFDADKAKELNVKLFPENPKMDESFFSKLTFGAGDFATQIAMFVAVSAAATPAVATGALFSANASRRFQENYRTAIDLGFDEDTAIDAGFASLPGSVIDSFGDRLIAGRFISSRAARQMQKEMRDATTDVAKAKIASKFAKQAKGKFRRGLRDSIAEGLSEAGGDFGASFGGYLVTGNEDFQATPDQLFDSFAIGAILGGTASIIAPNPEGALRGLRNADLDNISRVARDEFVREVEKGNFRGAAAVLDKFKKQKERTEEDVNARTEPIPEIQEGRDEPVAEDQQQAEVADQQVGERQDEQQNRKVRQKLKQERSLIGSVLLSNKRRGLGVDEPKSRSFLEVFENQADESVTGRREFKEKVNSLENLLDTDKADYISTIDAVAIGVSQNTDLSSSDVYAVLNAHDIVTTEEELAKAERENTNAILINKDIGDASTLHHETFHILRKSGILRSAIGPELMSGLETHYKVGDKWTAQKEEQVAKDYEKWLRDGEVDNPNLRNIFESIKRIFRQIYRALSGSGRVPTAVNEAFQKLYGFNAKVDSFGLQFAQETISQVAAQPEQKVTDSDQVRANFAAEAIQEQRAKLASEQAKELGVEVADLDESNLEFFDLLTQNLEEDQTLRQDERGAVTGNIPNIEAINSEVINKSKHRKNIVTKTKKFFGIEINLEDIPYITDRFTRISDFPESIQDVQTVNVISKRLERESNLDKNAEQDLQDIITTDFEETGIFDLSDIDDFGRSASGRNQIRSNYIKRNEAIKNIKKKTKNLYSDSEIIEIALSYPTISDIEAEDRSNRARFLIDSDTLRQDERGAVTGNIPEIGSFDNVVEDGSGVQKAEPFANYTKEDAVDDLKDFQSEEIKLEVGGRIFDLLGSRMYDSNIEETVVKEISQNSFDAIKAAREKGIIKNDEGYILMRTEDTEDSEGNPEQDVIIADNGIGMTPEILKNAFFTLGGTHKESERPSGGFGLAKMGILLSSKRIQIETSRDGILTTTDLTSDQLRNKTFTINSQKTERKNGTIITITFPISVQKSNGESRSLSFSGTDISRNIWDESIKVDSHASFVDINDFKNGSFSGVDKDSDKAYVGIGDLESLGFQKITISPNSADVDIYFKRLGKKEASGGRKYSELFRINRGEEFQDRSRRIENGRAVILSNGLYQFQKSYPLNPSDVFSVSLPYAFIINISPTVDPTSTLYPFINSREGFIKDSDVNDAIDNAVSVYQKKEQQEEFQAEFSVMESFDGGEPVKTQPVLYNNTTVDLSETERRALADLSRSTFEVIDDVVEQAFEGEDEKLIVSSQYRKIVNKKLGFSNDFVEDEGDEALDYFYGVGLSLNWSGVQTNREPRAIIINPVYDNFQFNEDGSFKNTKFYALSFYHTIFHEVNHIEHKNEGSGFTYGLSQLQPYLARDKTREDANVDKIEKIIIKHKDAFKSIRKKFNSANVKVADAELKGQSSSLRGESGIIDKDVFNESKSSADVESIGETRRSEREGENTSPATIYDTTVNSKETLRQDKRGGVTGNIPKLGQESQTAKPAPTDQSVKSQSVISPEKYAQARKSTRWIRSNRADRTKIENSEDRRIAENLAYLGKNIPIMINMGIDERVDVISDSIINFEQSRNRRTSPTRRLETRPEILNTDAERENFNQAYAKALIEKYSNKFGPENAFTGDTDPYNLEEVLKWVNINNSQDIGEASASPREASESDIAELESVIADLNAEFPTGFDGWIEAYEDYEGDLDLTDDQREHLLSPLRQLFDHLGSLDTVGMNTADARSNFIFADTLLNVQVPGIARIGNIAYRREMLEGARERADTFKERGMFSGQVSKLISKGFDRFDIRVARVSALTETQRFMQNQVMQPLDLGVDFVTNKSRELGRQYEANRDEHVKRLALKLADVRAEFAFLTAALRLPQVSPYKDFNKEFRNNFDQLRKSIKAMRRTPNKNDRESANQFEKIVDLFEGILPNGLDSPDVYNEFLDSLPQVLSFDDDSGSTERGEARMEYMEKVVGLFEKTKPAFKLATEMYRGPFQEILNYSPTNPIATSVQGPNQVNVLEDPLGDGYLGYRSPINSRTSETKNRINIGDRHFLDLNMDNYIPKQIVAVYNEIFNAGPLTELAKLLSKNSEFAEIISNGIDETRIELVGTVNQMVQNTLKRGEHIPKPIGLMNGFVRQLGKIHLGSVVKFATEPTASYTHFFILRAFTGKRPFHNLMHAFGLMSSRFGEYWSFLEKHNVRLLERSAGGEVATDRRPFNELKNTFIKIVGRKIDDTTGKVLFTPLRWGDGFASHGIFLSEYFRLEVKAARATTHADLDLENPNAENIRLANNFTERFVGLSGKERRAAMFSDNTVAVSAIRNLILSYSHHLSQLGQQLQQDVSDIYVMLRSGRKDQLNDKIRDAAGIMGQIAAFSAMRFAALGAVATLIQILIKELYDDEEGKIAELEKLVDEAPDEESKEIAEQQLKFATIVRDVMNKFERQTKSGDSLFKSMVRDQLTGVHIVFGAANGFVPNTFIMGPIDKVMSDRYRQSHEEHVRALEQTIREENDPVKKRKLKEDLVNLNDKVYIPFHFSYPNSSGVSGIYGSVMESIGDITTNVLGDWVPSALGQQKVTDFHWSDFLINMQLTGIGQSDINRVLRKIDKIEEEKWRAERDFIRKKEREERESDPGVPLSPGGRVFLPNL